MSVKTFMWRPIGAGIFLALAHAAGAAIVTPFVNPVSVFEKDPGDVLFTVQNVMAVDITITSVQTPVQFGMRTGGDPNDMVTSTSIGADNCTGKTLQPGGVCFFSLGFTTDDPSGMNNNDVGNWLLSTRVFATIGPGPDSEVSTGSVDVNVLDPVPEPGSATLVFVGIFALLAYWTLPWRMRRRKTGRVR